MNLHMQSEQQKVLSGLREALEDLRRDEDKITALVAAAREHDGSWQAIGTVLGTTKQAAWERFGKASDPRPARTQPKDGV